MAHSFTVYIDESGDEGFTFRDYPNKGSTDWFVLSAIITPSYRDHEIRTIAANMRRAIGLPEKGLIHFKDLSHEKRVRAVGDIAASHVAITSILVNKREINQPHVFTAQPFRLYFYAARLLIERLSWYCRDYARDNRLENPEARIIFEHRKRLSYDKLRNYLRTLHVANQADEYLQLLTRDVRVHWPAINIGKIEAAQKHDYAGLQIADCVASGLRWALEKNQYGNTEHRFAKMFLHRTYRHTKYTSYGLKFFPHGPDDAEECSHWIKKHYK
ncbi:DUF3800 domain-containing protein [Aurantimonas sp. E1-2-R+4]|uniref:DUF3800 domain-containing protein n=1 Tax=Aurantimonas sp. E1-2-R+4 TaxID=3113714 RepID=UPI002F949DBD